MHPIKKGLNEPFFILKLYNSIITTREMAIIVEVKVNINAKSIPKPKKSIARKIAVGFFIFPDESGLFGLSILSLFMSKRSFVIIPPIYRKIDENTRSIMF
jgi:hypothetical protein